LAAAARLPRMAVCGGILPNGAIGGCDWRALSPQLTATVGLRRPLAALVALVVGVALVLAVPTSATRHRCPTLLVLSARAIPDVLPLGGGGRW